MVAKVETGRANSPDMPPEGRESGRRVYPRGEECRATNMKVLGIETSCDETGVAVYSDEAGLVSEELYSQIALHREYGGVVPELASRDHVARLAPMLERVVAEAGEPDAVAYTAGPGLMGALLVGASL